MTLIQNPYEILYNRIERIEQLLISNKEDLGKVKAFIVSYGEEDKYIKPKEVKEKFGISLPTQISYDKKGILKPYYLGESGRNKFYKLSEVESALSNNKKELNNAK